MIIAELETTSATSKTEKRVINCYIIEYNSYVTSSRYSYHYQCSIGIFQFDDHFPNLGSLISIAKDDFRLNMFLISTKLRYFKFNF